MTDLATLKAQRDALDKAIREEEDKNRAAHSRAAREYCDTYGLSATDVFPELKRGKGTKRAVKYRDPHTGKTWSGAGFQPKWVKAALATGVTLEELRA